MIDLNCNNTNCVLQFYVSVLKVKFEFETCTEHWGVVLFADAIKTDSFYK